MKKKLYMFLVSVLIFSAIKKGNIYAEDLEIKSPSVILMETSTGQILYEKNADEKRAPASVTKVMTMLLILILKAA